MTSYYVPGIILGGRNTMANKRAKFLFSDTQINECDTNVMKKIKQHNERYSAWGVRGYFRSIRASQRR